MASDLALPRGAGSLGPDATSKQDMASSSDRPSTINIVETPSRMGQASGFRSVRIL